MARYIVSWKIVNATFPGTEEMRLKTVRNLLETFSSSIKLGKFREFGVYPHGNGGYVVFEGTEPELAVETLKYFPYVEFDVRPVISVDQYLDVLTKVRVPITA